MPGFGPESEDVEPATPANWDMNTPDAEALDNELSDISLLELGQEDVTQAPEAEMKPSESKEALRMITLPPTRAAANIGKGKLSRACMNECGGLCRQLCSKFKALKVCNGCVRGCLNKCDETGEIVPNEPFFDPFKVKKPKILPPIEDPRPSNDTDVETRH